MWKFRLNAGSIPELYSNENKWYYTLIPLTYGRARIIFTDGYGVKDGW